MDKYVIGTLILIILASGAVVIDLIDEPVKFKVDNEWGTLYVKNENNRWIVGGAERTQIFDGSSRMNRALALTYTNVTFDNITKIITYEIHTVYSRGPKKITTYTFDGTKSDIEKFPLSQKIEVFNASGKFLRYSVDRTKRTDKTRIKLVNGETLIRFPYKVNVELHPGYRWAWIGWPYGFDSLTAQYDIPIDVDSSVCRAGIGSLAG